MKRALLLLLAACAHGPDAAPSNAARFLAAIGDRQRGLQVLAGISSTAKIDAEGAWVGEYLLAARELGAVP